MIPGTRNYLRRPFRFHARDQFAGGFDISQCAPAPIAFYFRRGAERASLSRSPTECSGSYARLHCFAARFAAMTRFATAVRYQPGAAGVRRSDGAPSSPGGAPAAAFPFAAAEGIGCCWRRRGGAASWAPITFPVSESGARDRGARRFALIGKATPAGTVPPALRGVTSAVRATMHGRIEAHETGGGKMGGMAGVYACDPDRRHVREHPDGMGGCRSGRLASRACPDPTRRNSAPAR